jgi:hypothetical protein
VLLLLVEANIYQPMAKKTIQLSQLITVFAQGHTAITSIHLGRLAISSLHGTALAPKTWAELFWAADHNWQGPVGVAKTAWGIFRLRSRISFTFVLFATISLLAFFTPTAFDLAYSRTVNGLDDHSYTSVTTLGQDAMHKVITIPQLSVGAAGWITGQTVDQMYSPHLYRHNNRSNTALFFTDYIGTNPHNTLTLIGLQVDGKCELGNADAVWTPSSPEQMRQWCFENGQRARYQQHHLIFDGRNISIIWCTGFNEHSEKNWVDLADGHTTTVVAWINTGDTMEAAYNFFSCVSNTRIGDAVVFRTSLDDSLAFKEFNFRSLLDKNRTLSQAPFLPPLYAAFLGLSQQFMRSDKKMLYSDHIMSLSAMIGLRLNGPSSQYANTWGPHTVAKELMRGMGHMAAAIQVAGARTSSTVTLASDIPPRNMTVYERSLPWAIVTWSLLCSWLVLLVFATVLMFRPTFGESLNSYAAARLLVDMPHLVEGYCAGAPSDNPRLRTTFERVGDDNPSEDVGHVTSGGKGQLEKDRGYGARKTSG